MGAPTAILRRSGLPHVFERFGEATRFHKRFRKIGKERQPPDGLVPVTKKGVGGFSGRWIRRLIQSGRVNGTKVPGANASGDQCESLWFVDPASLAKQKQPYGKRVEWIEVDGASPAIIDSWTFDSAQRRLAARRVGQRA